MNTKLTGWLAGLVFALSTSVAQALLIDDFTNDQARLLVAGSDVPTLPKSEGSTVIGNMIGGERDIHLEVVSGSGRGQGTVTGGQFFGSSDLNTQVEFDFQRDGLDGDPSAYDPDGFLGVDFRADGATGIRIDIDFSDLTDVFDFTLRFDDADNGTFAAFTGSSGPALLCGGFIDIPYTDFVDAGSLIATFDNVTATRLQMLTAQPSSSWVFNSITQYTVPEPSALALLGIGVVGMGFTRRRMKA
jgi:hypothetical protein